MHTSSNSASPNDLGGSFGPIRMRWLATLDERTCLECLRLDGKLFEQGDLPSPPHENCRCCTVPDLGGEPVGSRATVFGPVSHEEGRFVRDVLIRMAELRHQLVSDVETMLAQSNCRAAVSSALICLALTIADVDPQGPTLDRVLSGDDAGNSLVRRVCAACIEHDRVADAIPWLHRCCSDKIPRDVAFIYWLQAAETLATSDQSKDAARTCCTEALACAGLDCSAMLKVARAMDAAGNRADALAIANRVLESSPTSKAAKTLIAKLSG
jgi:hypothetical protein